MSRIRELPQHPTRASGERTKDKRVEHTARIIWIIGQTEVELISSVCNRGCICCISSFPRLSCIVVVGRRQGRHPPIEADSRQWQFPGQARPTHPFITPRISHSTTATTMQSNAKSAQQSAVKIYNAVYSSVQVCPSLSFLPIHRNLTSATIARRSMNVWSEASRSCAGARTPT